MAKPLQKPVIGDPDYPIYELGIKEGKSQQKMVVLTYLQERYMNQDIERGSAEAKAILAVAQDVSAYLNHPTNG